MRIAPVDAGHDRRDVERRGTDTFEIVGREAELASVRAFVDQAGAGLAALVLDGDAGIGKSTLWLAGVEHARARACGFCRHGRRRPSGPLLTQGSAICLRTPSRRPCPHSKRREGVPSRS